MLRIIWDYRGFILGNVKRDFQARYQNSLLGGTWAILSPVAMIFVYTVVFSQVMHTRLPGAATNGFAYSIYLCAGILTWGLFTEIVNRAIIVFIENANLLKKLSFPRICLPVTLIITACLNFSIIFGLFTLFLIFSGNFPGRVFLAIFPVLAVMIALAAGMGILLGVLNVFFRDVGQFFALFLTFWFWLTPIVYPSSILPQWSRPFMQLNPMSSVLVAFQTILVEGRHPDWSSLLPTSMLALLFCVLGYRMFRKHAGEMVDEL